MLFQTTLVKEPGRRFDYHGAEKDLKDGYYKGNEENKAPGGRSSQRNTCYLCEHDTKD